MLWPQLRLRGFPSLATRDVHHFFLEMNDQLGWITLLLTLTQSPLVLQEEALLQLFFLEFYWRIFFLESFWQLVLLEFCWQIICWSSGGDGGWDLAAVVLVGAGVVSIFAGIVDYLYL